MTHFLGMLPLFRPSWLQRRWRHWPGKSVKKSVWRITYRRKNQRCKGETCENGKKIGVWGALGMPLNFKAGSGTLMYHKVNLTFVGKVFKCRGHDKNKWPGKLYVQMWRQPRRKAGLTGRQTDKQTVVRRPGRHDWLEGLTVHRNFRESTGESLAPRFEP